MNLGKTIQVFSRLGIAYHREHLSNLHFGSKNIFSVGLSLPLSRQSKATFLLKFSKTLSSIVVYRFFATAT